MTELKSFDVVVAGGGPAGIGAALAATANGARTLLLEQSNAVGGTGVHSLVPLIHTAGSNGGIVREYRQRLAADGCPVTDTHSWAFPCHGQLILLEMIVDAGVELQLHTRVGGVKVSGSKLEEIQVCNKRGGPVPVRAPIFIDATGDGDLAAWAGVPYDKGRVPDGRMQAVSFNFQLAGVDPERVPDDREIARLGLEAAAAGALELPDITLKYLCAGWHWPGYPDNIRHFQLDMAFDIDASDPASLTRGEVISQLQLLKFWRFLKRRIAGFEHALIVNMSSYLGVRETRRIRGEKTVTEEDVLAGRKHPDGIARCSWYMDLHDGQEKLPPREYRAQRSPPPGDFYEIPYGCLVPQQIDGLLVAGRCISSTRPANGSLRLQPTCMNLGQAAGVAAAICCRRKINPRELSGIELRAVLKSQNMEL